MLGESFVKREIRYKCEVGAVLIDDELLKQRAMFTVSQEQPIPM